MKRLIQKTARRFGLDVRWYPIPFDPDAVRSSLLSSLNIQTVIDVGANEGQYAEILRRNGYSGRIISFEPLSTAYAKLTTKAAGDSKWDVRQLALGDSDTTGQINICNTMSSILPKSSRGSDAIPFDFHGSEQILIRRLDSVWSELNVTRSGNWLKIDTQGFEAKVI